MHASWNEFRATTDPLSVWLDRVTVSSPDAMVPREVLRRAYATECLRTGTPPMTSKAFMAAVRQLRPTTVEAKRIVAGERVWCWLGLGLAQEPAVHPSKQGGRVQNVHDVHEFPNCFEIGEKDEEKEKETIVEMMDMVDAEDKEYLEGQGSELLVGSGVEWDWEVP